jgi:membrane-associated phospholipid phosphatase
MNILGLNDLALELVARDYSPRKPGEDFKPNNVGPTATARALALIHQVAFDAYAKVTGAFLPRLSSLPNKPSGLGSDDATGTVALLSAGIWAAEQLYPDFRDFITEVVTSGGRKFNGDILKIEVNTNPVAIGYGQSIADAWFDARKNDNSELSQFDKLYSNAVGKHRPDPTNPGQSALGRTWGQVKPFVLANVKDDAFLMPPPPLNSPEYAAAYDEVVVMGRDDTPRGNSTLREKAIDGIFWGYDGSNRLGTPPRLYNQVVRAIPELKTASHVVQIKVLTAINVAMADAAIAAWFWKYEYDFWRPVVGIREADKGWGPTGAGDGNTIRAKAGNPFWLPLGAPQSNPTKLPIGNFTPNFPAYPSGHSTFGSACFETAAALLGKQPENIMITFVSDEFNGKTTDNTGAARPKLEEVFSLRKAIQDNEVSRVYLGVHWRFDATGGRTVGEAIANKVVAAFR